MQVIWLEAKPTSYQAMHHYKDLTAKGKAVHENSLAISIVWYRLKVPGFTGTHLLKISQFNCFPLRISLGPTTPSTLRHGVKVYDLAIHHPGKVP